MDVEAELALHGYSDPSASLFRGCHICLLPPSALPPPSAPDTGDLPQAGGSSAPEQRLFHSTREIAKSAADTEQALQDCQAKRVSLQAMITFPLYLRNQHLRCLLMCWLAQYTSAAEP